MGSADIRLSFVLYNMAVKNTNQRLSLTLITQPFVFVSIVFVFISTVFLFVSTVFLFVSIVFPIVQVVREEHKRGSLPRTNNSTTIIHLKLGYTLNPRAGCEQFDI